jgi:hypothetical protein
MKTVETNKINITRKETKKRRRDTQERVDSQTSRSAMTANQLSLLSSNKFLLNC